MNELYEKISTLIPSQLPEFVRDDVNYETFVLFLQAYYEWMEQIKQVTYETRKLTSYFDVDETLDEFIQYYINEFLPYFPQDALADQRKVLKIAKELYTKKGTPASYKLLFRLLYNSDVDILITGELVLRASAGNWFSPKFLKISSSNNIFRNETVLRGLRVFGEESKALAVIEICKRDGARFDLYISDIQKLFKPGENIYIVDVNNQFVYSLNGEIVDSSESGSIRISGRILGEVLSVTVDSKNQGSNYKVGDPVVFYGGLQSEDDVHAVGFVSETTSGSINRVGVVSGGYGYTLDNTEFTITSTSPPIVNAQLSVNNLAPQPNTLITFLVQDKISTNSSANDRMNVTIDSANLLFDFPNANANTTLTDAFRFTQFNGFPISAVLVNNGGVGYPSTPVIVADSMYECNLEDKHKLRFLGILAPVIIQTGGQGYVANDTIVFTGGSGHGAFANVTNVDSNGAITEVTYVYDNTSDVIMPLGGMGYQDTSLPALSVISSNNQASGASLYVPCVLGSGSSFSIASDSLGLVKAITLTSGGTDYTSTPSISLRVQDILINNNQQGIIPRDSRIYQLQDDNDPNSVSYISYVASQDIIFNDTVNNNNDVYLLRTYNYNRIPQLNLPIYVDTGDGITNTNPTMSLTNSYDSSLGYINGTKTYGDGNARAIANYVQILGSKDGYYISTDHQPSSYSLLQSEKYNDFSYEIAVEQPIFKYRDAVKGLLHPSGLRLYGKDLLKSSGDFDMHTNSYPLFANTLQLLADSPTANVSLDAGSNSFTKIVQLYNINKSVSELFANGQYIEIITTNGYDLNANPFIVYSDIASIDDANDRLEMTSGVFLKFANVAFGYTDGGDYIYISNTSLSNTPSYDIVNNKNYSNENNHLIDIVFENDIISLNGNYYSVINVNSNVIYVNTSTISSGNSDYPIPFTINRTISTNNVIIHLPY